MTETPCSYDDQIRSLPSNSTVLDAENSRHVAATSHPYLLPPTTPRVDVVHPHNYFQLPVSSLAPHHDESNPPPLTYPSYSVLPARSEASDDTPADCGSGFCQPPQFYDPWGSFYPSPDLLPDATYGVSPPPLPYSTLDPTLYPHFPCHQSSWSTGVNSADGLLPVPGNYYPPAFSHHNASPSPHLHLGRTSKPYSRTLVTSALYPCKWTEDGAICGVMVQATRPHMNRHLHAYHGFGGSDTRQTKCYWTRCRETMQQGSIARHMVTCHLHVRVTCPMCSKKLSRQDVIPKHQLVCPAASTRR